MTLKDLWGEMDAGERSDFARRCGTTATYLRNIVYYPKRRVGTVLAAAIERESAGRVTRQSLRPTDWHLAWPELAARAA